MSRFTFTHELRVRWSEVDPQGIVFNPNYFVYADIVVTEYQRAIGLPYPSGLHDEGVDLFAIAASARFRGSARYDDLLTIGVRTATLGKTSVAFDVDIGRGDAGNGEPLVELTMTYVTASLETRSPVPLPKRLVDAILAFESEPPARKVTT